MRASTLLCAALVGALMAALLNAAPPPSDAAASEYHIVPDHPDVITSHEKDGKKGLYVTLHFQIRRGKDGAPADDVSKDEITIKEDGRRVSDLEIFQPHAQGLTTVLVMDVSGSMASNHKIDEARKAAHAFLDKLDAKSDSGLILFDHRLLVKKPPGRDPAQFAAHRQLLHQKINEAKPGGGTAYLDATDEALHMLKDVKGRKAVVLMTDGVDMNSTRTMFQVIEQAKRDQTPIYTVGIGEPGKNELVTTVLVLDHSGSMAERAADGDDKPKIEALREAASRFVELMRPTAKTTLLPFSSEIQKTSAVQRE